jgi:DNA-binding transcriptional LysR family regulator
MELRQLRYFVAIAEELSFTKAAARLHLAQPSLTRQIKNLEQEIDVQLFDRIGNRIQLTDPGREFLARSQNLLAVATMNVKAVQKMKSNRECELRIGYVSSTHFEVLQETIAAFRKQHSNVRLSFHEMTCAEQLDALQERSINVGFVGGRLPDPTLNLSAESVNQNATVVAHSAKHSVGKTPNLRVEDFSSRSFIENADFSGIGVTFMPNQQFHASWSGMTFRPLAPLCHEYVIVWHSENCPVHLQSYVRIVKEHPPC